MASQPQRATVQRLGYVGIDFGSTGTRVVVAGREINQRSNERIISDFNYQIQDSRADDGIDKRFDEGEYPSVGCAYDGQNVIVGYDAANQTGKRTVSLKSMVYFLSDNTDNHPFTEALCDYYSSLPSSKEKENFRDHLESMLLQFFTKIIEDIVIKAQEEKFDVRCITLCIPNTWSSSESNIQKYLGPLLDKTVSGKDIEITFTFEAAARAQYLLRHHPGQLTGHNYLMVLDFGGHSMGGFYGELRWKHDGRPSIYSPSQSDFGLRGGYEIWEIEIGKAIDQQMTKDWRARERFPDKHRRTIRAAFLDVFFREKAQLPLDKPKRLIINLQSMLGESDKHTFAIDIPVEVLNAAWDTAYRQILNLAKKNIQLVAKREDVEKVFILLSGGSIANSKAKNEIMEFCNTLGRLRSHGSIKNKITVKAMKDIQTAAWKWTLAQGAAKALAMTMSVQEFFDRGAALGIQTSTFKGNFTQHTSGRAKQLLWKEAGVEKHFTVQILLGESVVIRLIADPDFVNAENGSCNSRAVLAQNAYDIWQIPFEHEPTPGSGLLHRIPEGYYKIDVSEMKYDGWDAVLILRLRPDNSPAKRAARRAKSGTQNSAALDGDTELYLDVPLVSHGENNIVVLDQDRIEGRFWKPKALAKPPSPSSSGELRKRQRDPEVKEEADSELDEAGEGYDGRPVKRSATADT
ncbi:hypothetical protein INS49_010967 [Diaporthe citri]|uniref:uncharacterized protein n=1 Tax=Diaporthe citri TaxID=83186 RepID=UPI001C7F879A|nr:uncharacterized protein INS49_010967 [Diaporthe citri]KAG6359914.1 hypothetical protein INS49_010967 [Diaporthe citri]